MGSLGTDVTACTHTRLLLQENTADFRV